MAKNEPSANRRHVATDIFLRIAISIVLLLAVDCPRSVSEGTEADARALMIEAARATAANLKSGKGEGTVRRWDGKGTLVSDVRFAITFEGEKYHVRLDYVKMAVRFSPCDRRIVVSDSSAIFCRDMRPNGEGADTKVVRGFSDAAPCMYFTIPEITRYAFPSQRVFEQPTTLERLPDGGYRVAWDRTKESRSAFEASPRAGYRVVLYENFRNTGKRTGGRTHIEWRQKDGVWFVVSRKSEEWSEGDLRARKEMRYDTFTPNVRVDPELFSLRALGLKPGERLADMRGPSGPRRYEVEPASDAAAKRAESMLAQLKELPRSYPERPMRGSWWPRVAIVAVNVLAAVAVSLIWVAWRRHVRRKAKMGTGKIEG